MMKVYTQTWYRGNNYGSVLQAYALQHTISDMGYACSVLNYKPTKADMWKLKFINHSLKETIQYKINEYLMKKNGASEAVNNLSLFDDFRAQHMQITPPCSTAPEIARICGDDAVFVCGSDQIWNTDFSWDKQPDYPFFLDFVPDDRKKIAYSSSFGEVHMSTEVKQKVRKLLERYDAIAVRENSGKNLVEDMGLSAKVVLDPTMLCDRTVWDELAASRLLKQDYVLLFQINPNKELLHFAEEFARSQKMNLVILSANPAHKKFLGRKAIYLPKVEEWLSYFKYASYVLTDSFHACVFSVQFERQFAPVVDQRNTKRISSVLELLDVKKRIVEVNDLHALPGVLKSTIHYDDVKQKLKGLQKDSGEWLLNKLETD